MAFITRRRRKSAYDYVPENKDDRRDSLLRVNLTNGDRVYLEMDDLGNWRICPTLVPLTLRTLRAPFTYAHWELEKRRSHVGGRAEFLLEASRSTGIFLSSGVIKSFTSVARKSRKLPVSLDGTGNVWRDQDYH